MTTFSDSRNLPALSWKLQEPGIRLKYGVNLVNAKAETIFNYIGLENVESWTGRLTQTAELSDLDDEENAATGNKFRSGDVLFGKLRPYLAKAFVAEVDGCCTSELLVLRPIRYDSNYLKYLLLTPDFINLVNSSTYGAKMPRATWDFIGNISLPTLPLESQKLIARFLDRKTATIDTLIAKKQRLIQLLEEKRTALINQAVTKGLNPNAPMKDSGIPWIGEIPEHWGIVALGYICSLTSGGTPDRNRPEFWSGDIPWVKTGEINYNYIHQTEEYITEVGLKNSSTKLASKGTLLMAMYGQGVTRGRVAILDIEASFNQACLAIYPHQLIEIKYLYYYFVNAYQHIRDDGNETSQMNLSSGLIGKIKITLPTIEEQRTIASFLDGKVEYIDSLKQKLKNSIEKLQEYRRSLITAAVTGKLEISEAEADV